MRWLFVKRSLGWPRSRGHDVHGYHMVCSLARLGHEVTLLTEAMPWPEATAGLDGVTVRTFADAPEWPAVELSPLQAKYLDYFGTDPRGLTAAPALAAECGADAVVAVGLDALPYLSGVRDATRVWYAADESALHHLSLVRWHAVRSWGNVFTALVNGLYERLYAGRVDRGWVVSEADRSALKLVAGIDDVDVVRNGVDADHYTSTAAAAEPRTCAFWGRLDFEPNVRAVEWFCTAVWPLVRARVPDARFAVYGYCPTPEVRRLAGRDGVTLVADCPDLRPALAKRGVAVLPFVTGGGVKNKLLEAAALGMAVVGTPRTANGLTGEPPLVLARTPAEWADALALLWQDGRERARLGREARAWVMRHHTWEAAARAAAAGITVPPPRPVLVPEAA